MGDPSHTSSLRSVLGPLSTALNKSSGAFDDLLNINEAIPITKE